MKLESYLTALGSLEEQRRMDIISNNIANSNTPGFKKDSVHFSDVMGEVSYTSMAQGQVRETGEKFDVALAGDGFLSVQSNQGVVYTRAGNLTVNTAKQLVTRDGWPVLGKNGPIKVADTANFRINPDGQVFDGNDQVDQLSVVTFPSDVKMKKTQNGYFQPQTSESQPVKAENCQVRQGALEGANFNPVEEMVKMVDTMRNFETYQKTMQMCDSGLDSQVISKLSG
jgi:flagellar basal-body rod protein FlgG